MLNSYQVADCSFLPYLECWKTSRAREISDCLIKPIAYELKWSLTSAFIFTVLRNTLLKYCLSILSSKRKNVQMVHACWWYYFSKFTEFFDTVSSIEQLITHFLKITLPRTVLSQIFFVLRKKTSQVSTLHVIHHGVMPMSGGSERITCWATQLAL